MKYRCTCSDIYLKYNYFTKKSDFDAVGKFSSGLFDKLSNMKIHQTNFIIII